VEKIGADRYAINAAYHNLIQVREAERNNLSHDLHDQVIQDLIGLKFIIAEKAPEVQSYLQNEINTTINMLRDICSDLKPPALEVLGLVAVLESYIKKFKLRNDLDIELQIKGTVRRINPEAELALFRIIQKALNNIRKHAKSASAIVLLEFSNESISLCVSDNGGGFLVPESLKEYVDKGHFGLMNMLERAEAIGGEITFESKLGQGTTIKIFIPKC
jgi:signal transduction histidine kinase